MRKEHFFEFVCSKGSNPGKLVKLIPYFQENNVVLEGPTPFTVPGYSRDIILGYLTSFAYPIQNSGELPTPT